MVRLPLQVNQYYEEKFLTPCGCAYHTSSVAETAQRSLIGMSVGDLDMCAGLPTKSEQINPATQLRFYEQNESTNSGINLTFPVIGFLPPSWPALVPGLVPRTEPAIHPQAPRGGTNVGNGGNCDATFKPVNGQVTALSYAGDTSSAGLPDAVCAPIVRTCVQQKPSARKRMRTSSLRGTRIGHPSHIPPYRRNDL